MINNVILSSVSVNGLSIPTPAVQKNSWMERQYRTNADTNMMWKYKMVI